MPEPTEPPPPPKYATGGRRNSERGVSNMSNIDEGVGQEVAL